MGDDIDSGLLSMAVSFDFHTTNVVQLSNRDQYFYQFRCHHPLITHLKPNELIFECPTLESKPKIYTVHNTYQHQ